MKLEGYPLLLAFLKTTTLLYVFISLMNILFTLIFGEYDWLLPIKTSCTLIIISHLISMVNDTWLIFAGEEQIKTNKLYLLIIKLLLSGGFVSLFKLNFISLIFQPYSIEEITLSPIGLKLLFLSGAIIPLIYPLTLISEIISFLKLNLVGFFVYLNLFLNKITKAGS